MSHISIQKTALAMLAVGLMSGCSLIPHYERPEAPVAANYPIDTAQSPSAAAAADIGWRNFFPDKRLQLLIAAALDNNRDLRAAAFRIEEARAQYNIQSADLLPNLNLEASANRARSSLPSVSVAAGTGAVTVNSSYRVGLTLASYELDFFGRVRSLNQAALDAYLATEEARRAAQISIVAEVAKAYLAERAFAEQFEIAKNTLQSRQTAYDLAKKRFDVGATSALDLRQDEILFQTARASYLSLQRQHAQAENALTLLVGKPLSSLSLPAAQTLSDQNIVTDIPAGLPSDLLERRPDIRASEQRLLSANANIGAARAAFFPRISLTAGIGSASTELSGLFDSGSKTWSFIPQLVLPIFDAGRNQGNLNLTEARKNLAVVDYEQTIQIAFREVADALAARATLDQEIEAQRLVQDAQAERFKLANLRYQNGIASSLDLLDAQRDLYSAQQSLVQARLLRLTNAVDLYRSLGGGLQENTVASASSAPPASTTPAESK